MQESRLSRMYYMLYNSVLYGNRQVLDSNFKTFVVNNAWNKNYNNFLICGTNIDNGYTMVVNFNNLDFGSSILVFYYKDNKFNFEDINLDDSNWYNNISLGLVRQCVPLFSNSNYDYNANIYSQFTINNDIYDDLKNSKQPTDIIFSMLYCLFPIILFLIGFKVLRKGLFK